MKKLAVYLLLLSLWSCNAPQPNEPFYCKINSGRWRPEKSSYSLGSPLRAEWNKKGSFNIYARNETETIILAIKLNPNEPLKISENILGNTTISNIGYYIISSSPSQNETLPSKSGKVVITKYSDNQVSGTFEFNVYSDIKKKEYKITKGQFNNLNYTEF